MVVASASGRRRSLIKIGYPIWVGFGPDYLAHSKGFFKAQGVDAHLQVIDDTKVGMAALAAKRIEAYGAMPNTVLLYAKADNPFVMVMTLNATSRAGRDGVVANKDIKSIKELKGKKVAFLRARSQSPPGYLLRREGLTEKDVVPVNMGSTGDAGAAFVANRVDAAVVRKPAPARARRAPRPPPDRLQQDSGLIIDTLAFRQDVVKSRPDDVKKAARHRAGRRLLEEEPEGVDRRS